MNEIIIGLGSNINPEINIEKAKKIIGDRIGELKSSEFIETEPIGYKNQDNFINGAVLVNTELTISKLTNILKLIETEMGRKKSDFKGGPRIIDLDILVCNGEVIDNDVFERNFLKKFILELKPDLALI